MPSSSPSRGVVSVRLLTGDTSQGSRFIAAFRVGDNSARPDGIHEYLLAESDGGDRALGSLVWDASHDTPDSAFFSVAQVILDVTAERVAWAVGTSDFISIVPNPKFKNISKVEIAAAVGSHHLNRMVRWDSIDVTFFCDGQGYYEHFSSPCLPHLAVTPAKPRRAAQAGNEEQGTGALQQFVEILPNDDNVTRVHIRGQITLRANSAGTSRSGLKADDLQGKIVVFTDLSRPEAAALAKPT